MTRLKDHATKALQKTADAVLRTKQGQWTIAGGGLGALAGATLAVGSVGVAGAFGAVAIPGIVLVGIPCLIVGNRIGVELEKRDLKKAAAQAAAGAAQL